MPDLPDGASVFVRRHWNQYPNAEYRLRDLQCPHWSCFSGGEVTGFAKRSPRPMVHGYVRCDGALAGEVAHSCMHGPPPHRIKVVVVAKDNDRDVMRWLRDQADEEAEKRAGAAG